MRPCQGPDHCLLVVTVGKVHAGHAPVATAHTGPAPFAALLAHHPRLTAIVAHLGAPDYEPFLDLAERCERVALDTTMAFTPFFERLTPFPARALSRLRALGLAGKVLLGSDFPNIAYAYAEQIAGLVQLGLGDPWLRGLLGERGAPVRAHGHRLIGGSEAPQTESSLLSSSSG